MLAAAPASIEEYLAHEERKELLRFTTAGSVDDGKSTLIGRLLYDSKGVYEDQIASVRKASVNRSAGAIDFSLLTDGLRAEREQGITIDVAYRYFSTPRRKFIIADTPGHEQYTRNMATGASTAHLAIVLVDARKGVLAQSRRHAYIASLLGIPYVVVAVNKMDLVDFRQEVFEEIEADFKEFAAPLAIRNLYFIPLSALEGDNVVARSPRMPWYRGRSLLEHLETVPVEDTAASDALRFPVQYVIRPDLDFRGYAGQVASGVVRPGETVTILPSGRSTRVLSIASYDGSLEEAFAPQSVTLCLADEIDISRGDMIVHADDLPHAGRRFDATVVWMHQTPLEAGKSYLLKHTTQTARATVAAIRHKVDIHTLAHVRSETLHLNEIGVLTIETVRPLFFDSYRENRVTGSFVLIDPLSNATLAAGMIEERAPETSLHAERVSQSERTARYGHLPLTLWIPGRPDLALALERHIFDHGWLVRVAADAAEARLLNNAGVIAIVSAEALDREPEHLRRFDDLPADDHEAAHRILRAISTARSA